MIKKILRFPFSERGRIYTATILMLFFLGNTYTKHKFHEKAVEELQMALKADKVTSNEIFGRRQQYVAISHEEPLSLIHIYVLTDDLRQNLAQVTKKVAMDLDEAQVERATISMIQSLVEQRLLGAGYITIAEHYISYRLQRDLERSGYGDHIAVHLHFEQIR